MVLTHQQQRSCLIHILQLLKHCKTGQIHTKWNFTVTGMYTQFLVNTTAKQSAFGSFLFIDLYISFQFLGKVLPYFLDECHCLTPLRWFSVAAHGNWSPWSGWGICSRTCNGGQMRRYRTCDNPPPSNGGRACGGPDSQIQRCNTDVCPGEPLNS